MKKFFVGLLLILSTSIYQSCNVSRIDHPIREDYSEAEFNALVEELKLSTVTLVDYYLEFEIGLGSGMIFKKEALGNGDYFYYVLTNNHVVDGVHRIMVHTGFATIEEGDIYAFPTEDGDGSGSQDIAIVRFKSSFDYPVIKIIPYEEPDTYVQLSVGQNVFGIGTPTDKVNHNLVTNMGIITKLSQFFISHTANINAGNSGGPLFAADGTFIGINTQRLEYINNEVVYLINDSIDVNQVARMIETRLKSVTPKIGISIVTYSEFIKINFKDYDETFDIYNYVPRNQYGAVIVEVNSTRSAAGILKRYDLIKKVDGVTVFNNDQLIDLLVPIELNRTYTFEVMRKNTETNKYETLELEVTINE